MVSYDIRLHNSIQIEMSSGWVERVRESRAARITELGRRELQRRLGVACGVRSGERNILASQSLVDRDSKIAAHLDPVFVPIRPSAKIKAHGSGGEINNICLG